MIKRGEHGVLMTRNEGFFAAPGMPLDTVRDPTGAGDTFAGGFIGYLASAREIGEEVLARAAIAGSALASLAVEDFGLDGLLRASTKTINQRFQAFKRLTHFEEL